MRSWILAAMGVCFLFDGCGSDNGDRSERDDCDSNPCVNGVCTDTVNGYSCACDAGWEGVDCDVNTDDCNPDPCVNGDCTDVVNGYSCACESGWEGVDCDTWACSQVSEDPYEGNDTCNLAEPLLDAAEGAAAVTVNNPTLHHTDQTLDTDWFRITATEGAHSCVPYAPQCYFNFTIAFTPPDVAAYATYEMCVLQSTCGGVELCTTVDDWNATASRYELSLVWEGTCQVTDDAQFYTKIARNGGEASCAPYTLEYELVYTDETCP